MATAIIADPPDKDTLAELLKRLGGISPDRIRLKPPPGTATEKDVIAAMEAPRKRLCELVEGVLVEKVMGATEALLATYLARLLWNFVEPRDLGVVIGADGPFRVDLGLVRFPDVAYISWERIPGDEFPSDPIARVIPNLAVEVLSRKNTAKEIARKLREYFKAGVELAWVIKPKSRTAEVYRAPEEKVLLAKDGILYGQDVLPGFTLPLPELFASTSRRKRR